MVEGLESRRVLTPMIVGLETTTAAYAASGTAIPLTTALTVNDSTSSTLTGATVSLGSTFRPGEDVLSFTNTPNITGSFNASTGTLTLSGTDTLANYQTALRSITYADVNANPTPNIRRFTFELSDSTGTSADANRYVNLTSLISSVETSTFAYAAGSGATPVSNTLTLGATANGTVDGATVKIDANYMAGEDLLSFTNTPNISGSFNAATGTLTLTGTDTVSAYQAALRSVTYTDLNANPTAGIRRFAINVDGATNSAYTANRYFNVEAAVPVISGVETTAGAYAASGTAVPVTSTLTLSDNASSTLSGATVTLDGTFRPGEDVLSFTNTPNITGSFNSSTGTLTLTGTDTLANYQAALRSITYSDVSANPTPNIRRVTITVNDGTHSSTSVNRYINLTSLISNVETGSLTYPAGSGATAISNTLTLSPTATGTINGATVKINANYVNGEDVLSFTNTPNITGSFNASTGTLTLTGTDTVAAYQAALRSITYTDTSVNPTAAVRRLAINVDGATNAAFTVNRYISVKAAIPVISGVETTTGTFQASGTPVPVTSTLTLSDGASATLTGAIVTLGTTDRPAEDVLSFTNTPNITGSFDAATGTLTLTGTDTLANYQAALRSITYSDVSANPTPNIRRFTITVNDGTNSSVSVNRYINLTSLISNVETGALPYSAGSGAIPITNTLTLGATASGTINGATVKIDANYVNGEDILSFVNTPNITGSFNAATGTLTLTGTDTVAAYQAALRSITYTDISGTPTTSVRRFAINVDGATGTTFTANRYFSVS